mmetsp:Transcript_17943/g.37019  ORF Transcript_17943/g.37019 Transcript_17943/m.37019 type:complete len:217 (+) Transcript_17943:815-1465(+)
MSCAAATSLSASTSRALAVRVAVAASRASWLALWISVRAVEIVLLASNSICAAFVTAASALAFKETDFSVSSCTRACSSFAFFPSASAAAFCRLPSLARSSASASSSLTFFCVASLADCSFANNAMSLRCVSSAGSASVTSSKAFLGLATFAGVTASTDFSSSSCRRKAAQLEWTWASGSAFGNLDRLPIQATAPAAASSVMPSPKREMPPRCHGE